MTKGKDKEFTAEELDYLRSLPAVERATPMRIVYTEEFKRACLSRYLMGDSPVRMFREAGLGPEMVGYKRIERCFSRWRADAERILGNGRPGTVATWTTDARRLTKMLRGGVADFADPKDPDPADLEIPDEDDRPKSAPDARDLLIARLNLRVEELEHEIAGLRRRLELATADATGPADAAGSSPHQD